MNETKVTTKSSGMSWTWLTTIILILLKAFGKINWTWFQCFLPAIVGTGIALFIVLLVTIVAAIE